MSSSERVHAYLDGDLPRHVLSEGERIAADAMQRDLSVATRSLRATPGVDLRSSVLDGIAGISPERTPPSRIREALASAWAVFWEPRRISFQLRPSVAMFAVILLLIPALLLREAGDEPPPVAVVADPDPQTILVQFRLDAPGANSVALAGSFSGWEAAVELQERVSGVWTITLPLRPGVHDYLFLVDDAEWVADPAAHTVEDDFGGTNSRLLLVGQPSPS